MDATHSHQHDHAPIDLTVSRADVIELAPHITWQAEVWRIGESKRPEISICSPTDRVAVVCVPYLHREDEAFQNADLMARAPKMDQALRFVDAMLDQPVFRARTPDHGPASIMRSDAAACRRIIADALRAMVPEVQQAYAQDRKHPRANDLMDTRRQD